MIKMSFDYLLIAMLFLTFAYCMIIDRRLRAFKSQEGALKAVVDELATATENAREATSHLSTSLDEMQRSHWENIDAARTINSKLSDKIDAAEAMLARIERNSVGATLQDEPVRARPDRLGRLAGDQKELLPSVNELARSLRSRTGPGLR